MTTLPHWNRLIQLAAASGAYTQCLGHYAALLAAGLRGGDASTFPSLAKSCAALRLPRLGRSLHAHALLAGAASDVFVRTSLYNLPNGLAGYTGRQARRRAHHPGHPLPPAAAFGYSNAAAFGSSLVVVVLMLLLDFLYMNKYTWLIYKPLRFVLLLDLLSLMVAYAAGTCRDRFTILCSALLVAVFFVFLMFQMYRASTTDKKTIQNVPDVENGSAHDEEKERRLRKHKILMVLATFSVSVTYIAGLSTPGGFWDTTDGRHGATTQETLSSGTATTYA